MSDDSRGAAPADGEYAAGDHRVRYADLFDAEVRPHGERFRAATDVRPTDLVLDIGCGTGQSTREAARAAVSGAVLGLDLSAPALEEARRRGAAEGLHNVTYERADAQVHPFPAGNFDLCISRFGTMFFADPVAAFTNIARALRPRARLVLLVWQTRDRNEWSTAVRRALDPDAVTTVPAASDADAFSLGDPAVVEGILRTAGFDGIDFTDVNEPVYYGPDVATAQGFILGLRDAKALLASLHAPAVESALERLRDVLVSHDTGSGVYFDSRAWIVTARVVGRSSDTAGRPADTAGRPADTGG